MNIIFNNQFSIFEDIFYKYLNPKQCVKFYSCNRLLYIKYILYNKFESNYFTPKNKPQLQLAVNEWCYIREKSILQYGHISYWNTINITDMSFLFYGIVNFNDDISDWNTSNVNDMEHMFYNAQQFNQSIGNWITNNVIYMNAMFSSAYNFNQLVNNWNTNNVINMAYMFYDACNFNQNLNKWNIENVILFSNVFTHTYNLNDKYTIIFD